VVSTSALFPGSSTLSPEKQRGKKVSSVYVNEDDAFLPGATFIRQRRRGRSIAFGWYGGKFSHLDWLLPFLPKCHHYCEPFAGSAAVLLNRPPANVETYNDIDGEVVNFFRTLRNDPDALIRAIGLTPFSREEYHLAIYGNAVDISDVERARRFYIRARQTRTGLAQTASLGRWANCKDTSRAGMSGVVSRWLGGVEALDAIAHRLLRVQIENRPALDILRLYDSPQTLFYCDPPYLHATRGDSNAYGFEMDEPQHREFAAVANECQGKSCRFRLQPPANGRDFSTKTLVQNTRPRKNNPFHQRNTHRSFVDKLQPANTKRTTVIP